MRPWFAHFTALDWADTNSPNRALRYLSRAALAVSLVLVLLGGLIQLGRAEWKRLPARGTR